MGRCSGLDMKIVFLQNHCAVYNGGLYDRLSADFDLVVYAKVFDEGCGLYKFSRKKLRCGAKFWIDFFKLCICYRPAVIVYDGHSSLVGSVVLCIIASFLEIRLVLWSLGAVPGRKRGVRSWVSDVISQFYCRASDAIACYGSHAESYFSFIGCEPAKLYRAQNSIDTDTLDYLSVTSSLPVFEARKLKVVYIGQLTNAKKVDVLIKGFFLSGIWKDQYSLIIIGAGPEMMRLLSYLDSFESAFTKQVKFIGDVRGVELSKVLLDSRLCVLPGRGGLAINTAMHHGLPVIAGSADGTEVDLVKNDITGYLLAEGTSEEIASALRSLSFCSESLSNMSVNSHRISWETANISGQANGFAAIFRRFE